jgi:UDPglucose--hexose-1-phosphate uridylyltransferase
MLNEENASYLRNRLLDLLDLSEPIRGYTPDEETVSKMKSPSPILKTLTDFAVTAKKISAAAAVRLEYRLLDTVAPLPSKVSEAFDDTAARKGIKAACDFLYDYYVKSNSIKYDEVISNLGWTAEGSLGKLNIMINMARRQRLPKTSARYPLCPLCTENAGFTGETGYPPRTAFRYIPLFLDDKVWYFHYSPFKYFSGHFNVVSSVHEPMTNSPDSPKTMFDFLEIFPHYFIAYNAPLKGIGASNTEHDHYLGGECDMPIFSAGARLRLSGAEFPDLRVTVTDWYNTALRLESRRRQSVERAYAVILNEFLDYSAPKLRLRASSGKLRHNATALTARFNKDNEYTLEVFLRNNYADEEHPNGVFDSVPEYRTIKDESIGVIESLGCFILPAELGESAQGIKDFMLGKSALKDLSDPAHPMTQYLPMIAQLINDNGTNIDEDEAERAIEQYINKTCERLLAATDIFGSDNGVKELLKLLKKCGFEPGANA